MRTARRNGGMGLAERVVATPLEKGVCHELTNKGIRLCSSMTLN